jgi:uracil phosphoribosyltransferase
LPKDIKNGIVLLLDATVATGAAAMMAIRVLLDHSVEEENIILVSLLMAEQGESIIRIISNVLKSRFYSNQSSSN